MDGTRIEQRRRIGCAPRRICSCDPSGAEQWQYHVEQYNMSDRWSAKRQAQELAAFNARLNVIGAQSWEMISYEAVPLTGTFSGTIKGYAYLCFFKRRVAQTQ